MLILWIAIIILCAILGSSKGYSLGLCILAGALGSVIAVIVLLLLPDRNAEQVELDRRDQEIDALRRRIAHLEQTQEPPEAEPAPFSSQPPPGSPPPGEPARFPTRTEEVVSCPRCRRRQKGNRDSCYACGLPFQYEDEP